MEPIDWTDEQLAILSHPVNRPARILAGPGTGKSTTVIALADRFSGELPEDAVRLATFTRAATRELVGKAEQSLAFPITTVHSLSLSLLTRNPDWTRLPLPIRIPDEWEFDHLVHQDLRDRLAQRWTGIRRTMVARLEREMAARWEALDNTILVADIDPELRDVYVSLWQMQRGVFAYSLFAEMPWYALELVDDHPDADLLGVSVLIVDEYQDLNRCEVELLRTLSERGVTIVAVGDDDQSIYSWRMAAPEGIREFPDVYPSAERYALSYSQRCARKILDASQRLIRTAPGRDPNRAAVQPAASNPEGTFEYLRFVSAQAERDGVVTLLQHHGHADGVDLNNAAVLLRGDYQGRWSKPLKEKLAAAGIQFADVESALEPLHTDHARELLAVARLALNPSDDLAWWTILYLRHGVSDETLRAIADVAAATRRRFHEQLERLGTDEIPGATQQSIRRATERIDEIRAILGRLEAEGDVSASSDWVDWLTAVAQELDILLSDDLRELLYGVAETADVTRGLGNLIDQLEPFARDRALELPGVSIMTVARSKGLTFDLSVTMGVESELFPSPMSADPEEDRRLLYVAITARVQLATSRWRSIETMRQRSLEVVTPSRRGDAASFSRKPALHPVVGASTSLVCDRAE